MPRIQLMARTVKCNVTEDDTGADEVYLVAVAGENLASPGGQAHVVREPKLVQIPAIGGGAPTYRAPTREMNNGDTWDLNEVLLDIQVGYKPVQLQILLLDQDAAEEIDEDDIAIIGGAITEASAALAPVTGGKSALGGLAANFLLRLIAGLISLDEDDLLGVGEYTVHLIDPAMLPAGFPQQFGEFPAYFKADMDGADYDVFYSVKVSP